MKKRFQAVVNKKHQFDLTSEDALQFQTVNANGIHARDKHDSVNASIRAADFPNKKYTIKINAAFYEVELKNELELLIDELGLMANVAVVSNELISPMPGLIVDILVKAGSKITTGDGLLILEAMKMENKLTASRDGVVKSVLVNVSDAVDKGAVLIEFENDEKDK